MSVHAKSPSLDAPSSPAGGSSNTNYHVQAVPTHPMTRQSSPSYSTPHTPYATLSQYAARSPYTPVSSGSTFEPFADEDALLDEAMNSCLSFFTPSTRTDSPPAFNDNDASVFFDEEEELGMSRNGEATRCSRL
jgi:hypothetical protein